MARLNSLIESHSVDDALLDQSSPSWAGWRRLIQQRPPLVNGATYNGGPFTMLVDWGNLITLGIH